MVFSRDGRHLASASGDGKVKLWDATRLGEKQEARQTLAAPRTAGRGFERGVQPGRPAAGDGRRGNTVKIWDVQTGKELQTLRGHTGDVYAVAFSPDPEAGGSPRRVRTAP